MTKLDFDAHVSVMIWLGFNGRELRIKHKVWAAMEMTPLKMILILFRLTWINWTCEIF